MKNAPSTNGNQGRDAPLSAEDQFTMAHNVLNRIDMLLAEAGFSQDSTARFQLKITKSMFRQAEKLLLVERIEPQQQPDKE